MGKSPDAFRTISEVAEWLDIQSHVLRFWESKFSHVKPVKRAGGRRYYRPSDMLLLGGIKKLLHDDGLTVKGVQKILREQGIAHVSSLSQELCEISADAANTIDAEAPETAITPAATVVPFDAPPDGPDASDADDPMPVQIEHAATDDSETTMDETPDSPPEPAPVLPSFLSAKTAAKPVPETEPETELESEPETIPEPDATPSVEETPVLPSFLHRPDPEIKTEVKAETKPESEPEVASDLPQEPPAEAKPSLVVDAPDPANEDDLPYTRGPLANLAGRDMLNADKIVEIAPLARQLQAWLARTGTAGAR